MPPATHATVLVSQPSAIAVRAQSTQSSLPSTLPHADHSLSSTCR